MPSPASSFASRFTWRGEMPNAAANSLALSPAAKRRATSMRCSSFRFFAGLGTGQTPRTKCANIGHILPTSSFSPSLILQYITLRNIMFCMLCLFAGNEVYSRPLRGAAWNGSRPLRCRTTTSNELPKLVFKTHATTSSQRARAGYGSGAENTKNARAGWRGSRPFRASRSVKETTSDPCGSEDPQGSLGQ